MSLNYTLLSEKKELDGTELQICGDDNETISVLQYKAKGQLAMSGTQIIITTADSQMAKFLRRKFSFLEKEYSHFELTRKGSEKTDIEIIHYAPDKKQLQIKQISP